MNKKLLILISIGALLLVGFSGFHYIRKTQRSFNPDVTILASEEDTSRNRLVYEEFGLAFEYPEDLEYRAFDEGDGAETLVFRSSQVDEEIGFQLFVTRVGDEVTELTTERILEDLPSAVIDDPQGVLIGVDKDKSALIFFSDSAEIGRTREIWFLHDGYLFEISTYADLDGWIGPITETFEFF